MIAGMQRLRGWRACQVWDVLSLARIIGHQDLKQLLIYFNPRAEDLVRLGENNS